MIDHAVESNSTHVWFNLAFPGAYAPFIQILTQTWSSILCKNWCLSLGRATEWDGVWGDYVEWATHYRPALPVLDDPQWAAMGNGPFKLSHLDRVLKYWDCDRFTGYWRGWGNAVGNYGVGWPAFGGSKPAGYIDRYVWTWAYDWPARSTKFLNGEVDLCYVPRSYKDQVENHANIRCMYPLPSISCDALFYTFDISPTTPYGTILDAGVLGETGIPRDFFGNATWGIYVRKAFSQLIDFDAYIQAAYLGEAMQPATALIPTLTYYNGSIPKYTFNKDAAITLLKKVPGLWETGFTIKICYNTGNVERQQLADQLGTVINSLNPKFHVETQSIDWATYLNAMESQQLTCFDIGWLGDYPDAHNFAYSFYATWGDFSQYQPYSNPVMDDLVTAGISSPDGPERARIYSEIAQLAIDDCPSVALDMAYGRHWEVSWLCGWYYNAIVPGTYVANLWKWYYTPHAQQDSIPANSTGNLLPYDVNYDGKTNMVDIGTTAASFGAVFGPPTSIKWVYRADFNNDRKIDMKDIGGVAKNFGKTATAWTPPV
jgi:peptide/nickel transport system substrate-binding protein